MLALETVFKQNRHKSLESLRQGLRLLLTIKPTTVEGKPIESAERAEEIERLQSQRIARIGVCILLLGFCLQVVNRGIDIARLKSEQQGRQHQFGRGE